MNSSGMTEFLATLVLICLLTCSSGDYVPVPPVVNHATVPCSGDPSPLAPPREDDSPYYSELSLEYDYYRSVCPKAESIIRNMMRKIVSNDTKVPAQLLRLVFHDCFIQGCDASVLLDDSKGNSSHMIEKMAIPNQSLKGFEQIDMIKAKLENECPGLVSCADIIVVAARDGIVLAGGPFYPVLTGRKDSIQSFFDEAFTEIPSPNGNISETLSLFFSRGFREKEIVSLLGSHNIGKIGCEFVRDRLFNYNHTRQADPSIAPDYVGQLQRTCSNGTSMSPASTPINAVSLLGSFVGLDETLAAFIPSGTTFDSHYYQNLIKGRGLLFSDQQLMANPKTAEFVREFAGDVTNFRREFAKSMLKLSNLQTRNGNQGEVRSRCTLPN